MRKIVAAALAALSLSVSAAPSYTMQSLELESYYAQVLEISNSGLVLSRGTSGARLSTSNGFILLPGLPGINNTQYFGLNDAGQVVGGLPWLPRFGGALYEAGRVRDMSAEWYGGFGRDINNAGMVTGFYDVGNQVKGFVWSDSIGFRDIGIVRDIVGINDMGQVIGMIDVPLGSPNNMGYQAFIWEQGSITLVGPRLIAGEGLLTIKGFGPGGEIFGNAWTQNNPDGFEKAFLVKNGVNQETYGLYDIDGIDATGRIYGVGDLDGKVETLVYVEGMPYRLSNLVSEAGWEFIVKEVSDSGLVVAEAWKDDMPHAVLLTPIPEPTRVWMMLAGIVLLAVAIRFKL